MTGWFEFAMVALLPITALITVLQQRPYYALISRGIMGVVAVLIYASFGAADVALTEALVGTLLTVILFAIAVRTSLAIRVGVLADGRKPDANHPVRRFCSAQCLYERWVIFDSEGELVAELKAGRLDAACFKPADVPLLGRYLSEEQLGEHPVTLLAEHCRWHERKIRELLPDDKTIARMIYAGKEADH
ncbi:hydrogenase subunit MbhD domain-containing protein [Pontiella sp.]|uniref:hydrogenase subunit MbhD domain-containing protein n=1 Tax=Pontiella sp. TaxID=2837462 RepID=UPI0035635EB7